MICFFPDPVQAQTGWKLVPSLSLSETYDSNIFSRKAGEEDEVTRLGTRLRTLYTGPDIGLHGNYSVQMQMYARHPSENGILQDGSFDLDLNRWFRKFSKTGSMTIKEDFSFTPELQDYYFDTERQQVGSLSSSGIRSRRTDSFRNSFALDGTILSARRWNVHVRYSNLLTEYKDPALSDNLTNSFTLGTEYAYAKKTLYTELGENHIRWDKQDTYSTSYTLGLRYVMSREIQADLNSGLLLIETEGEKHRTTWSAKAEISKQGHNDAYRLGYSRKLNSSSGIAVSPPIAQLFFIHRTGTLKPGFTSTLDANYALNESLGRGDLDTRSYNLSAGLAYQVRLWLQAHLTASHFNQSSKTAAAADMKRDIVSLTLTGTWQ